MNDQPDSEQHTLRINGHEMTGQDTTILFCAVTQLVRYVDGGGAVALDDDEIPEVEVNKSVQRILSAVYERPMRIQKEGENPEPQQEDRERND